MSTAMITFNDEELALIKSTIAKGTDDNQFKLFVQVCRLTGLNPFARQIYAVVRSGAMTIQTGIDGYRVLAERSGKYAGQVGPEWCDESGEWRDYWISNKPPVAARVGVLRRDFDKPIWGMARFASYEQSSSPLWKKMPEVMLAKCAESLALRRAFPSELSGIYTKEEMDQADSTLPTIVPVLSTKELYRKGYEVGLWESVNTFCQKASEVLGFLVTKESKLTPEQRQLLYMEIEHPADVVDAAPVVDAE